MYSKLEKRQFIIFLIIAYGVTYLMGLLMWYGNAKGVDLSAFPNAQMMYPAAGVMLAYLLTCREDKKMPRAFYISFILVTIVLIALAVVSVFDTDRTIEASGMTMSVWGIAGQYVMIVGSIICWICYFVSGKERRISYGLKWRNWKSSVFCIVLFFVLYMARMVFAYALGGEVNAFLDIMKNSMTWIMLLSLPLNFFLVFVAFFGEEYGWRYYLQPFLQKKFGLRGGVLILGLVWGIWHLPVDFFFYVTPDKGLVMLVSQLITCTGLGIFFAYAYMKTNNIWVPVILHFMNNNLVPIVSGTYSADVLQDQQIAWSDIPMALLMSALFFGSFIISKVFTEKKTAE